MKLLQLSGTGSYTTGLAHSVFQALRMHSVFQGFRERSTTFLAEPKWRELPWASYPASKGPHDQLLDILLETPSLYAQSDTLVAMTCPHEIFLKTLEIIRESQRMDSCLVNWFTNFEATVAGPIYYHKLSRINTTTDSQALGKVFPLAFNFPAFIVGQTIVFYWIALIIVHAHMCPMYQKLASLTAFVDTVKEDTSCTCDDSEDNDLAAAMTCLRHFAMDLLPPLGHRTEWPLTAARNICQSIEYSLQEKMRGVGPSFALPALATVKAYWKFAPGDWSREAVWVNDVLSEIQGKGNRVAGYIKAEII